MPSFVPAPRILASLAAALAATTGVGVGLTVVTLGISDAAAAAADAGEIATATTGIVAEGAVVEVAVEAGTTLVRTAVLEASEELIAEIESVFETMIIDDPELVQIGVLPWIGAGATAAGGLTAIAPPTVPQLFAPGKAPKPARNDPSRIPHALPSGAAEEAQGKWIGQEQPKKDDKTLVLYYKPGWTTSQNAQATKKAAQLEVLAAGGQLVAAPVSDDDRAIDQRAIYNVTHGLAASTVHPGEDVDHIHELQLGGSISPSNLQLLDASVNRSIGAQIASQIRRDGTNTKYSRVVIIDPPRGVFVPPGDENTPQ